jgi:nitrite reductase/ring-hydroxylating ferredoxin subunit
VPPEDSREPGSRFAPAGRVRSLEEGCGTAARVHGREVTLFLCGGEVHAVAGRCPHNGLPLEGSSCREGIVTCRWHGWRFDVRSGLCPDLPPGAEGPRLRVHAVRVREGEVEVALRERGSEGPEAAG